MKKAQPDALLRLEPAHGGQSHITEDDYLQGPPALIVEISAYDLHDKRRVYARNGKYFRGCGCKRRPCGLATWRRR